MSKKDNFTISDEKYVLDLCDEILNLNSLRKYSFEFLFENSDEKEKRTKLAVGAFYEELNLIIEYTDRVNREKITLFDKINEMAISIMYKGKERKIYDKSINKKLPKNGFKILEISYRDFNHDSKRRIIRNKTRDKEILKEKLNI